MFCNTLLQISFSKSKEFLQLNDQFVCDDISISRATDTLCILHIRQLKQQTDNIVANLAMLCAFEH